MTNMKVAHWRKPEFATSEHIEASKTYHLNNPHNGAGAADIDQKRKAKLAEAFLAASIVLVENDD